MNIAVVILAAGKSERMGQLKPLLPWGESTVLQHTIDLYKKLGATQIAVVVGFNADLIKTEVVDNDVTWAYNYDFEKGMSTSFREGFKKINKSCDAIFLALADTPDVKSSTLQSMAAAFGNTKAKIIIPICNNRKGHPVLFSADVFSDLETISETVIIKDVVDKYKSDILFLETDDEGTYMDIDIWQQYQNLFNKGGSKMDLIIKNGTIITAKDTYCADIGIKNGKIAIISKDLQLNAVKVVDAAGKFVLPGAVDAHVHLETPVANTITADSYEAGTRAAACGGVTTVFDFAVQKKGHGLVEAVMDCIKLAQPQACIDYGFHTAITEMTPAVLAEFEASANFGVPSFKLYMVYDNLMVNDTEIAAALQRSKETNMLIAIHAENPDFINEKIEKLLSENKKTAWYHYESRPEAAEAVAVKKIIDMAKSLQAQLYIVHLSSAESLEAVAKARNEGYEIYAETCPQYLNFTNEVYKKEDGRYFVCSPSIKGEASQKALWAGIENGYISTVATDHCPFQSYEKDWGKDDFTKIPNGVMGLENMYPYMLSEANNGRLTFNKVVELCSTNPAKIFGCAPQKGTIAVGGDADIVIYDPHKEFTISKENMHSDVDYTIWEGVKLKGYPVMTFSRGKLVYENGEFLGESGCGRFIKCFRR